MQTMRLVLLSVAALAALATVEAEEGKQFGVSVVFRSFHFSSFQVNADSHWFAMLCWNPRSIEHLPRQQSHGQQIK